MHALVTGMLITAISSAADPGIEAHRLNSVWGKANVVVIGSFVDEPQLLRMRRRQPNWLRYDATIRIVKVLKDEAEVDHQPGQEIDVRLVRAVSDDETAAAPLTTDKEYLFLLKHVPPHRDFPTRRDRFYFTLDPLLGVPPATPALVDQLVRRRDQPVIDAEPPVREPEAAPRFDPLPLAVAHTEQLDIDPERYKLEQGKAATYTPQKGPVRWLVTFESRDGKLPLQIVGVGRSQVWQIEPLKLQPHVSTHPPSFSNLTGRWRLYLPAGYEHDVTLASVGHDFHVLSPTHLNMGGVFVLDNNRLVSMEEHGRKKDRFVWSVRTPYLMTLVESTDAYGATYDHAVLFRPKSPEGESKSPPTLPVLP